MTMVTGIALAFVAMLSWGLGDFLIQKSTRKMGDWETLFLITAFGFVILLPFVFKDLVALFQDKNGLTILVAAGLVMTVSAILHFEGFKKGKLSVLEPLISFEIPAASILAWMFLDDKITIWQIIIIVMLMIGLFMVSFREKRISKEFLWEKGVIIFTCGAILMGVADFLIGWGSRETNPIMANFVINTVIVLLASIFILIYKQSGSLMHHIKTNKAFVLAMVITDNIAWIAYAVAMTIVPIAVATGLSESSIIVAVLLGLFVNREKLQRHQKIGLVLALGSVIALAFVTAI